MCAFRRQFGRYHATKTIVVIMEVKKIMDNRWQRAEFDAQRMSRIVHLMAALEENGVVNVDVKEGIIVLEKETFKKLFPAERSFLINEKENAYATKAFGIDFMAYEKVEVNYES